MLTWPDGDGPNMILDDGGDATLLVHKGTRVRGGRRGARAPTDDDSEEYGVILDLLRASLADDPTKYTRMAAGIQGVTEETTTGVHRLYEFAEAGDAAVPGDQRQRLGDQVASSTTSTAAATR